MESDDFLGNLRKQLFVFQDKDDRYDQKILLTIARTLGIDVLSVRADLGKDLNLSKFNPRYMPDGIAVEAIKLKNPITVKSFVGDITKTEYWKAYVDLKQNWSTYVHFVLVFDKHGDEVGDLVLHSSSVFVDKNSWVFQFSVDTDVFYVQPLKSFLRVLGSRYNENYNEKSG